MKQIYPDLWQTHLERPISGDLRVASHAYLLVRPAGNVLIYGTGREANGPVADDDDLARIAGLGGITHQLLAHWHEASPSLGKVTQRFGSTLIAPEADAQCVFEQGGLRPDLTLTSAQTVLGDIEAIPTPGHTAGSVSYLYRSPHGRTYLFTGDTILPTRTSWSAIAFEDEPGQPNLRASLKRLRALTPDAVFAAAAGGDETFREVSAEGWQAAIDAAEASLDR